MPFGKQQISWRTCLFLLEKARRKVLSVDFAMSNNLDLVGKAQSSPTSSPSDLSAHDQSELGVLRAMVVDLLAQINRGALQTSSIQAKDGNSVEACAEFVSMLSHELRNPLQSMAMAIALIAPASRIDPAVAQAHSVLHRQISHMSRLLDDLLDASRVASGKIVLQLAPLFLREAIEAAVETSGPGVALRRQHLTIDLPDDGIGLTGDLVRLTQVFSNLLVNASQFTPVGGNIVIAAARRGQMAEITVSDDGTGIPIVLQPHIFDLFTQGERTLERAQGGLGIGLALVQKIVCMHGGCTTVNSAGVDAGSSFTVSLPVAASTPATPEQPSPNVALPRKILIIEDNVDANEMMGMLLEMQGHQVTSSFDGVDGLRIALERSFDIVLCDLGLPGMTGLEVAAAIKERWRDSAPFVIATTGYSDGAQRDLARAAGFDYYLTKPIELTILYQVISSQVVGQRRSG
jgi:signal transduction histidine kinase/ActR/RegA family two-component response regulator